MTTKTQQLIETSMEQDQGDGFRAMLRDELMACDDAYRPNGSPFRRHLGASLLGKECGRELWYSFRWFKASHFNGRMQRLFNRGHLEEGRFIAMLKSIGVTVWSVDPSTGKQFRMSYADGHLGGSLDSVLQGTPDYLDLAILGEYKTHNLKSFNNLKSKGVKVSKKQHYVQMQLYMHAYNLPYSLYMAVCKDNDELYTEIVVYDRHEAEKYLTRGTKLIYAQEPPPRISNKKTHFICKFCDYYDICHNGFSPEKNCRTCVHAHPVSNGEWKCGHYAAIIPRHVEENGCDAWVPFTE